MHFDWRLVGLTQGVRRRIALAAALGLAETAASVARLGLTGAAIALVFQQRPLVELARALAIIVGLLLVRIVLHMAKQIIAEGTAALVKVKLRRMLYAHLLTLGPGSLQQRRTGDVLMTCVDGVEQLQTFFGQFLPQLIVSLLAPIGIFWFMVVLDPPSAFIFVAFAAFTLAIPNVFRQWTARGSAERRRAWAAMGAEFLDAVQGLPTLKVFGQSRARGDALAARARHVARATMIALMANIAAGGLATFGMAAGAAVVLGYGAVRVAAGDLALAPLLVVLFLGTEIFRPIRELNQLYHQGVLATSAAISMFALLDERPDVQDVGAGDEKAEGRRQKAVVPRQAAGLPSAYGLPPSGAVPSAQLDPTIRFEHVTFAYEGGRRPALRGLSFELPAGESLALVGPSGAGKSTVVALLLRFFDPQEGRILLGGHDLRTLPLETLRRQVAMVAQDTYLFHGTVAENLRLGKADATQPELEAACLAANAHEFVAGLPDGYDTIIGERGVKLSGGQRQRLAIARALLKDAPILILDEATSSVDAENEAAIQEALERLMRGRTTLVIAHRLSTVAGADQIVVLEQGRRVESGTHAALLAAGGTYTRLVAAQELRDDGRALGTGYQKAEGRRQKAVVPRQAAGLPTGSCLLPSDAVPSPQPPAPSPRPPEASPSTWVTTVRLVQLVRESWRQFTITLGSGLARAGSTIALGVVSAYLVGQVATGGDVTRPLIGMGILAAVMSLLTFFESWIAHDLAYRLLAEMRIDMYRKLDPLSPAYLIKRRSGDLTGVVTSDVELIESFFAHAIAPAFVAFLVPGVALLGLTILAWPLAVVLLPFLVATAYSPKYVGLHTEQLGMELRRRVGEVSAHFTESVQGLREVVAFSQNAHRLDDIAARSLGLVRHQVRFGRQVAFQDGVVESLQAVGGLAVMAAGAVLVSQEALPAAQLPLATMLAFTAFGPVADISRVGKRLAETFSAARRVFAVHDEPVLVRDGAKVRPGTPLTPTVRFEHVTFRYETGPRPALRGISFGAAAGQTIAIVGRSGAGKTTAAHLLLRFWDPQEGRILLGGHDVRDFALDDLRARVAFVAQDTYLFNTTISENLRLARPEATDAEVEAAARLANAHEFIRDLPSGYSTVVGERGVQLSGGQRQRLAIARALLKDAPILILDEATSHLDAAGELEVRGAIGTLMRGRTTIVIAHRLSTVRNADRIVVLDEGCVAEQGTHEELLARNGPYARLVRAQLQLPATGMAAPVSGLAPTSDGRIPAGTESALAAGDT